jgi:hypothetical protein
MTDDEMRTWATYMATLSEMAETLDKLTDGEVIPVGELFDSVEAIRDKANGLLERLRAAEVMPATHRYVQETLLHECESLRVALDDEDYDHFEMLVTRLQDMLVTNRKADEGEGEED